MGSSEETKNGLSAGRVFNVFLTIVPDYLPPFPLPPVILILTPVQKSPFCVVCRC